MPVRRGRPSSHQGRTVQKSVTLDSALLERFMPYANGNLSQALNDLIREELGHRKASEAVDDMARIIGVDLKDAPEEELTKLDKEIEEFVRSGNEIARVEEFKASRKSA